MTPTHLAAALLDDVRKLPTARDPRPRESYRPLLGRRGVVCDEHTAYLFEFRCYNLAAHAIDCGDHTVHVCTVHRREAEEYRASLDEPDPLPSWAA